MNVVVTAPKWFLRVGRMGNTSLTYHPGFPSCTLCVKHIHYSACCILPALLTRQPLQLTSPANPCYSHSLPPPRSSLAFPPPSQLELQEVVVDELLILQSLSEYDLYNMGRSIYAGKKVATAQTNDDAKEEECQTDEVGRGCKGGGIPERGAGGGVLGGGGRLFARETYWGAGLHESSPIQLRLCRH